MPIHLASILYCFFTFLQKLSSVFEMFDNLFAYYEVTVSWEFGFVLLILVIYRYRGFMAVLITFILIYRLELHGSSHFGITLRELGMSFSGDDVADAFSFVWGHFNITERNIESHLGDSGSLNSPEGAW